MNVAELDSFKQKLLSDHDSMINVYRQMLFMRRFEERVGEMYTRARIGGYTHLNNGEEATIMGCLALLKPHDYVFTTYREHAHALSRGVSPSAIMAELFGKEGGVARGRGGSMHIFDYKKRFMGGYGIVGGNLPLANGVAYAVKYRGASDIVACIFGEGSTNIGAFHESLNLAKLWGLPIIFICLNNGYAMGDRPEQNSAVAEIYQKACAYNMVSERVDGLDYFAVREASERLFRHVRENSDPVLLETVTYRLRGHSMADPARYRTQEEVRSWMARDPIDGFLRELNEAGIIREKDPILAQIAEEVDNQVEEAVHFAEQSPFPDLSTLYDNIYDDRETIFRG